MDSNELGRIHSMCFYLKCERHKEPVSAAPLIPNR